MSSKQRNVLFRLLEQKNEKPKPKRKAFSKDMRIAVNTIRQSLTMVSDSGINLMLKKKNLKNITNLPYEYQRKSKSLNRQIDARTRLFYPFGSYFCEKFMSINVKYLIVIIQPSE